MHRARALSRPPRSLRPRLAARLVGLPGLVGLLGLASACGGSSGKAKHPEPAGSDVTYPAGSMSAPASDGERVLGGMKAKIRACYEDGLKKDAKAEGVVRMQMKVAADGAVTSAKPIGDTTLPAPVVECLGSVLATAKFAPPGPGGSTLEVPLSFTRKDE